MHWGLAKAPAALVGALLIVDEHPFIKVGLQDVRRVVELLSERDPVELIQQRLVEALANTVGLRALHLGAGVVDVLDSEIQLIFVAIMSAAILGAAIGQNPVDAQIVLVEER